MTTGYNIVFPAKGYQKFDGGMNSKFEKSLIKDDESPDCLNVVFSNGAVATREGTAILNTAAVSAQVGDGIYVRHTDAGAESMVVWAGGTAFVLSGTTFSTIASSQQVYTAGVRVCAAEYENHLFMCNGYVLPYKYNGSAFTRHGVYPTSASASFVSETSSTGLLNGSYNWKFTSVNSQAVESDISTATASYSLTNGKASITSIPVAPQSWGVNARNIYRTVAGGVTYKYVGQIADNTTTVYTDNVADSALGVLAPDSNGVPPLYNTIAMFRDRLFVNDLSNPNYVFYSNLGDPYNFDPLNFFKIGDATSDLVRVLFVYDNSIMVGCNNSIHKIILDDDDPNFWYSVRLRTNFGCKSPFAPILFNNKALIPAMQNSKMIGFAAISGASIDPQSTTLDKSSQFSELKSDPIEPDIFGIQEAYITNISGLVYQNKAYFCVTYSGTTNNRVYVADFSLGKRDQADEIIWSPITGINAAQMCVYDSKIYYISSTNNGFVYRFYAGADTNYIDNTTAIDSYFFTKEFSGLPGHESYQKDFRKVHLLVDKSGDYSMALRAKVDSVAGVGQEYIIDLDPGSYLYAATGTTNAQSMNSAGANPPGPLWGSGQTQEDIEVFLNGITGKRIQFKFANRNTTNQKMKVHGLTFTYNIKGQR